MGKPIQGGWESLRAAVVPGDAPEAQIQEMRKCFYAGAHHLFHYIMKVMEPGAEVTEKDLEVMSDIDIELREFSALLLLEALSGARQHG